MIALLIACSQPVDGQDTVAADLQAARTVGDPAEVGLLAFLNDASTTFELLDVDVALDARSARYLIAARNGSDGVYGTADDQPFESRERVDDVKWVGPVTLATLEAWAEAQGWVPTGDDHLGTFDGVDFTVDEAERTVLYTNTADEDELDHEVPLDRRAVDSILAAREIGDVGELAGLYFVGKTALTRLKAASEILVEDEEEVTTSTETCEPTVDTRVHDDIDDFSELLELTTTVDAPWAEVLPFQATRCETWSDESLDLLFQELWPETFVWEWSKIASYVEVGSWTPGGAAFTAELELALDVIAEHEADGDFDPSDPAIADLYEIRESLVEAITVDIDEEQHLELEVYVDLSECSQEAVILLDQDTSEVTVVHRFSNC